MADKILHSKTGKLYFGILWSIKYLYVDIQSKREITMRLISRNYGRIPSDSKWINILNKWFTIPIMHVQLQQTQFNYARATSCKSLIQFHKLHKGPYDKICNGWCASRLLIMASFAFSAYIWKIERSFDIQGLLAVVIYP